MFAKILWLPLVFCIPLTTVAEQPAADKQINVLWKTIGFDAAAYLGDCYFSLVDMETIRDRHALADVHHHLDVQRRLLRDVISKWEAIPGAYPDAKDVCSQFKEIATALIDQNEALEEFLSGDSKNLDNVHAKRAVTRKLLVALTGKEDGDDDVKGFP
jgi:hypothetical protein